MKLMLPPIAESMFAVGGGGDVGKVVITTTIDTIEIRLTGVGFCYDLEQTELHSVFYSAFLAYILDDIYFRETSSHFPAPLLDALSGAARIQVEIRAARK